MADDARIGFLGGFSKGEVPVIEQDQSLDIRIGLVVFRSRFGQIKAGLNEGNNGHFISKNLSHHIFGIQQITQGQHCGRVGVEDEGMWQIGVEQGFDRTRWAACIQHLAAHGIHHVLVREAVQRAQFQERVQPHAGQAIGADRTQIVPAAFHVNDRVLNSEQVWPLHFARGVAAAMLHQIRVATNQTRGIGQQSHLLVRQIVSGHPGSFLRVSVFP